MRSYRDADGTIYNVGDKFRVTSPHLGVFFNLGEICTIKSLEYGRIEAYSSYQPNELWSISFNDVELVDNTKCSKCHQVLPKETELQYVTRVIEQAIETVRDNPRAYSCVAIFNTSYGSKSKREQYRKEYAETIKHILNPQDILKEEFANVETRVLLLKMFLAKKTKELTE